MPNRPKPDCGRCGCDGTCEAEAWVNEFPEELAVPVPTFHVHVVKPPPPDPFITASVDLPDSVVMLAEDGLRMRIEKKDLPRFEHFVNDLREILLAAEKL